jgi:hypothetical protein
MRRAKGQFVDGSEGKAFQFTSGRLKGNQYAVGHKPINPFPVGHEPANLKLGKIRLVSQGNRHESMKITVPKKELKTDLPLRFDKQKNVSLDLSRYNYEKTYGAIKKRWVIRHVDGNHLNNNPENLAQISRAENLRLNIKEKIKFD